MKQPDGTLTIASEQAQLSEAKLRQTNSTQDQMIRDFKQQVFNLLTTNQAQAETNKRLWDRVNLAERRTDLHLLQVQELSRTISRLERENAELRGALSACAPETDEVQS